MHDDPTFFAVVIYSDWLEQTAAIARAVSGIHVHVQAVQASRTMITDRAVLERLHFFAAVRASEGVVRARHGELPSHGVPSEARGSRGANQYAIETMYP